jgi:5-enolpyruvylshikimate-3-phosphate synthase
MALCVAALAADGPSVVADAACAAKSWPGFHEAMRGLGVAMEAA